ncbi:MAG TPA: endonuclease/exonuclease/phosphatase family protein [Acidobacteriota bacterium]|nr:endonuclease/exonuclease/phosphatase family protein [Acidobacteriota bacterium]
MLRRGYVLFVSLCLFLSGNSSEASDSRCGELATIKVLQNESVPAVPAHGVAAGATQDRFPLTIVSLNLADEENTDRILADFGKIEKVREADIFLFQQVGRADEGKDFALSTVAQRLGMHLVAIPTREQEKEDQGNNLRLPGLASLSRYPFRNPQVIPMKHFDLRFNHRCRVALAVTVDTPRGPIRVYNLHLDTRINEKERLEQLESVLESAADFQGPVIIGGDFNTANVWWFERMWPVPGIQDQEESVRTRLASQGFYTPFESASPTFKWLFFSFQLDWIFLSHNLKTADRGVEEVDFSDHRLLWVTIES